MISKKCAKCEVEKAVSEFCKEKGMRDGLRSCCRKCETKRTIAYQRTKPGLVASIYGDQRAASKQRRHPMPTYTRQELKEWLYSQPLFHVLYNEWVVSGYKKDIRPSCDRIDDYQGYCLSRMQLMTWKENNDKSHRDRKNGINNKKSKAVKQFDLDGNLIKEYYSQAQAERETGVRQGNIWSCCSGRRNYAGGFTWGYSEN